jgi:hypothetical protein
MLCHSIGMNQNKIEFSDNGAKIVVNGDWMSIPLTTPLPGTTARSPCLSSLYLSVNQEFMVTGSLGRLREFCGFYPNIAPEYGKVNTASSSKAAVQIEL